MRNYNKSLKIIISIMIVSLICIASALVVIHLKNNKTNYSEKTYYESNSKNLSKVCLDILYSDDYEKIIKYYPKLLYENNNFNEELKLYNGKMNSDELFDFMQNTYLFSYLFTNKFDEFKQNYAKYYPYFRTIGPNYDYILTVVYKSKNKSQVQTILDVLNYNLSNQKDNQFNQIGNLNAQSLIYEYLGDIENKNKIDKQIENIITQMKKNN